MELDSSPFITSFSSSINVSKNWTTWAENTHYYHLGKSEQTTTTWTWPFVTEATSSSSERSCKAGFVCPPESAREIAFYCNNFISNVSNEVNCALRGNGMLHCSDNETISVSNITPGYPFEYEFTCVKTNCLASCPDLNEFPCFSNVSFPLDVRETVIPKAKSFLKCLFLSQDAYIDPFLNVTGNLTITARQNVSVLQEEGFIYDFSFLFLTIFILAGGGGNILVCLAIWLERRLHNVTNYFLMSLAIADLLVSLVVMPFGAITGFLGYWPFGEVWCNIYVSCDVLACTSSIMHMCTISLGRYLGIRNPLKTRNNSKKTVAIKVVLVWLLAMLVTSYITVLGIVNTANIMPSDNVCAINNQTFFIFGSLCAFYIPMVIMIVSYALTVHLLRKKAKFADDPASGKARTIGRYRSARKRALTSPGLQQEHQSYGLGAQTSYRPYTNGHSGGPYTFGVMDKCEQGTQTPESIARETRNFKLKALRLQLASSAPWNLKFLPTKKKDTLAANAVANEQKASKVLGLVFFAFVICWTPFFILNIFMAACPQCSVSDHVANLCLWLGYVSSTINPIIYTIFNRTFKSAFAKLLCCDYSFSRHLRMHSVSENLVAAYANAAAPTGGGLTTSCSLRTLSTYVKSPSYPQDFMMQESQEHQC